MKRLSMLLLAAVSAILVSKELLAQQDSLPTITNTSRERVALRLVPGLAYTSATFGDDNPQSEGVFGITFGGQALAPVSRIVALSLEAIFQFYEIQSAHLNERLQSWYVMGGVEFSIGKAYLRPNVGAAFRLWAGGGSGTSTAPALGIAIGFEQMFGRSFHVSPEVIVRVAYEHGASTVLIGSQVPVGLRLTGGG